MKVQKFLKPVPKSNEGQLGNRKYKYADLSSVMEYVRAPLAENGLAVSQACSNDPQGVCVVTTLRHESGEAIESPCFLPVVERTPQGYGSAITYARRYGLSAILGLVTEEDDDGAAASTTNKPPPPEGMGALREKIAKTPGEVAEQIRSRQPSNGADVLFPNYGNKAKQPVRGASKADLDFYLRGAEKSLADPAKASYREANAKLVAAIKAEIARADEIPF